jgi:hypothetical protein
MRLLAREALNPAHIDRYCIQGCNLCWGHWSIDELSTKLRGKTNKHHIKVGSDADTVLRHGVWASASMHATRKSALLQKAMGETVLKVAHRRRECRAEVEGVAV